MHLALSPTLRWPPAVQVQAHFEQAFGAKRLQEISQRLCVPSLKPTLRVNSLRLSTEASGGAPHLCRLAPIPRRPGICYIGPAGCTLPLRRGPLTSTGRAACTTASARPACCVQEALRQLRQVLPPGSQQPYIHPLVPLTLVVPGTGPAAGLDYTACGEQTRLPTMQVQPQSSGPAGPGPHCAPLPC